MDDVTVAEWIAAGLLAFIGIVHSVLGERLLLRPLFAHPDWSLPRMPREPAERVLRFAWHLTTIAWWAIAAALVGASPVVVFSATCLSAAVIILVMLPGHIAWPAFLAAGLLALGAADAIAPWALWTAVALAAALALVAAAFHVAWALGSRRGVANVIPQRPDGSGPTFRPRPVATLAIAIMLLAYVGLAAAAATGRAAPWVTWLLIAALAILAARVVGDGRWVGVTKRVRHTGFAVADDRYWTPAAGTLALGAAAALVLA